MSFSLKVISGPGVGKSFVVSNDCPLKFGRLDSNDYVLAGDKGISRHHFEITCDDGKYWIKDLNSRNGTYLNQRAVLTSQVNKGDEIRAGSTTMMVSISTADPTQEAIRQSGLEAKAKVEFRITGDETTVTAITLRLSKLPREVVFSDEFNATYYDLPGKVLLLNEDDVRSSIDRELDFETVGQQAVLIFPKDMETILTLRDQYFGRDSLTIMNHSCRRTKLVSMINDSFSKFAHPTTLVDQIKILPSEATVGLMKGIDLAVCETSCKENFELIHDGSHSGWINRLNTKTGL